LRIELFNLISSSRLWIKMYSSMFIAVPC
jgi:hypothetical protein